MKAKGVVKIFKPIVRKYRKIKQMTNELNDVKTIENKNEGESEKSSLSFV